MIPRQALFGKLNLTNFRAIEFATPFVKLRGNFHGESAQWIRLLIQFGHGNPQHASSHFGIDPRILEHDLARALFRLPSGTAGLNGFSHDIETAIRRVWLLAPPEFENPCARGAWLMLAIVQHQGRALQAHAGRIDPLGGRSTEIRTMTGIASCYWRKERFSACGVIHRTRFLPGCQKHPGLQPIRQQRSDSRSSFMSRGIFLKIDGSEGESHDSVHRKSEIDVLPFGHDITDPRQS